MGLRSVLRKPGIIFGGFLGLATLSIMNSSYTNVLDEIKSELVLNYTWAGALMSGYFVGYTLGQIPWGILSDRYGSRRAMSLSILGISLSTLLFGYSSNIMVAVVFRFLSGLLGAGIFVPGVKLVSSWFNSEERGTALGLLNIGGSSGMIAAAWIVPLLSVSMSWRGSLKVIGLFGVFSALISFYFLKDREGETGRKMNLRDLPVRVPSFWYLSFVQFIRLGAYYTFIAWMPLVLREEYGLSVVATSGAMSLLNFAGILSNPAGGIVADRFGEKRVLMVGFFSLMVFILLFTFGLGNPVLYVLIFLLGWVINFTRSPAFSIIPGLFGAETAGSISGINNTFASLGALVLPFLLGYVRDTTSSYTVGWYAVAGLSLLATVLMYFVATPNPKNV
ncbi:MAG: MFS transporter [Candidatus Bathyarchaeota archaeon]